MLALIESPFNLEDGSAWRVTLTVEMLIVLLLITLLSVLSILHVSSVYPTSQSHSARTRSSLPQPHNSLCPRKLHGFASSPPPSIFMSAANCKIPANPDIAGIGVRIAIYVQTLLCFIPAFWALVDGKVTRGELEAAETQATTNLVLAFAILVSSIVQAQTLGLNSYHASIVLNMSWMNNTNAFIYFLLYIQYKSQPGTPRQVPPTWGAWARHIGGVAVSLFPGIKRGKRDDSISPEAGRLEEGVNSNDVQNTRIGGDDGSHRGATILIKRFVLLLGSLHLSLMAGLGLWLWSNIRTFGEGQDAHAANECAAKHALVTVLGRQVPFASEALRVASFVVYTIFLVPGLNLLLPVTLFLGFHTCCRLVSPPETVSLERMEKSSGWGRRRFQIQNYVGRRWGMLPSSIGLIFLLAVNIVFIADIELPLKQNADLQGNEEAEWGFGQILAMLLLFMPLRDLSETVLARRIKQRQKDLDLGLKSAFRSKDWDTIRNLVERGADPHVVLDGQGTAIQVACTSDRVDVIRALLAAGADPNLGDGQRDASTIDSDNKDCLHLLSQFYDRSKDGKTLLIRAANRGYGAAVKLILQVSGGAVIDKGDKEFIPKALRIRELLSRETTLAKATEFGKEAIVRLLLALPGIDVNAPDDSAGGLSTLSVAARLNEGAILKLLLAVPGVDVNAPDTEGRTPLGCASLFDCRAAAKLLLATPGIDVNGADHNGSTPLMLAASEGHEAVVDLLLAAPNIDVNERDPEGMTPLGFAAWYGHDAVVDLLLAAPNIDVNAPDLKETTPLCFAAWYGHEPVLKLLLAAPGIDVNVEDRSGRTALCKAAWKGHKASVNLLLAAPGIDINLGSPLSLAARFDHEAVLKLLLSTPGVDVNAPDIDGRTALIRAARHGNEAILKILLATLGVNVHAADSIGRRSIIYAAEAGHEAILKLLLAVPGIDVNGSDTYGRTPLALAAGNGHQDVIRILLSVPGIDINARDSDGCTPLMCAAKDDRAAALQLLLGAHGVDVNARDTGGRTAASYAAELGHEYVLNLLLTMPGIDVDTPDTTGWTILTWAVYGGTEAIVKTLCGDPRIFLDVGDVKHHLEHLPKDRESRKSEWKVENCVWLLEEWDRRGGTENSDGEGSNDS